jgi:hypothetical protein
MYRFIIFFILSLLFYGCSSSLLPSIEKQNVSKWNSYDAITKSYAQINPLQTTKDQLHTFGFDPFENKNIKLLNYLDVMNKFLVSPSIHLDDLDPNISSCLKEHSRCSGYEITIEHIYEKRYGNVLLDLFNFRKKIRTTGWKFHAMVIFYDNLVVYKIANGDPNINVKEEKKNPLGPFQSMESILRSSID